MQQIKNKIKLYESSSQSSMINSSNSVNSNNSNNNIISNNNMGNKINHELEKIKDLILPLPLGILRNSYNNDNSDL